MTIPEILDGIKKQRALVVGDICLDRWCTYDPATSEPSAETGIARLGIVSSEVTPGGGGTVANNLAALGAARVAVLGVRGNDGFGFELDRALTLRGIDVSLMVGVRKWQTFTYTKLLNSQTGAEDQPRTDFINTRPLPAEAEQEILANIASAVDEFEIVVVGDQAETSAGGVVTPAVRESLSAMAAKYPERIFLADSRRRVHLFRHLMVKPNQSEAEAACKALFGSVDFKRLREVLGAKALFLTHGPKGALVVEPGRETWSTPRPVENPVDICGAGDSFAAGTALTMAVTHDPVEAASFGNLVASITVMKKGTGTASPAEVLAAAAVAG
ncbi:MAG TPA: PfkB family carbohydrate kinase [Terriglobia bacterium]|nr:PfkB family carbohydrate kinase [Terriglobia bacterium]